MAEPIVVSCPECEKQMKAPPDAEGKKVRCRACGHTFTVKAPRAKAAPAKAAPAPKPPQQDLVADHNPYGVTDVDLTPRCPHCAGEMEEGDVVCLHCGYNTMTRERAATRKVYERTGGDYFLWLLPGIACVLADLLLIAFILFLLIGPLKGIAERNEEAWWNFGIGAMRVWGTVISLFCVFFATRFAVKRLILNPVPPERDK